MQATRVAAVSMNGLLGESERVLAAIDGWCERAAAAKADLVLFPELVVHGHCTPNTWELAEPVPDGPSVRRLMRHRAAPSSGALRRAQRKGARYRLQHPGAGRPRWLHRQAAEAAPVARRGELLQGRPGHPGVRHRALQGGHGDLLRQSVPGGRPRAGPARGGGAPDAPRRPFQAVARHARRRSRGPAPLPRFRRPLRLACPRECLLRRSN